LRARPRPRPTGATLLAALAAIAISYVPAHAAAPSPKFLAAARGTSAESLVRAGWEHYAQVKAGGVDQVYSQFGLDLSKYPRGGVAHRNIMVVLAQFPAEGTAPAVKASSASTPYYYWRLFFSDDPNDGIISLREYYKINSKGRLIISGQVTSKWLDMPHSEQYYAHAFAGLDFGAYPNSAQRLAEDAMSAAYDDFGKNLAYFDNDGPDGVPSSGDDDGYIDAVYVIHAGPGGEVSCPNGDPLYCYNIWSHEAGIAIYSDCPSPSGGPNCLPGMYLGNVRGFIYCTSGEYNEYAGDMSNGTYCHEFGHTLGLPDLYDPAAGGLGLFSLMSLGNYLPYNPDTTGVTFPPIGTHPGNLDAWCRQYLGFDDPTPARPGHYALAPVSRGGGSLKLWTNGQPGTEYYLVENRTHEGPDQYLPGEGLLVYHIDDTKTDNLGGVPNYRVSCVQADSVYPGQLESSNPNYGNFGDPRDFFPGALGKRSLTSTTSPNSKSFAGANTGIAIYNVVGRPDSGVVDASFDLAVSSAPAIQLEGYVLGDGGDGFADPNETDTLTVTVRNVGLDSAPLTLTLATGDSYVTVDQGASSAPALAGGATEVASTPFVFSIGSIPALPHTITFTLGWSDGGHSGTQDFTVTVGLGSGLAEDFESGSEPGMYWSEGPVSGTASEWHASGSRHHSGTRSAKMGSSNALGSGTNLSQTYAPLQDAALVSPAFALPPGSELVFYSYIDAATNGGTGCWDGGRVEISLNGGPWTPLQVDDGYGYVMEFNSEAVLRGSEVFSGSPQTWRRVTADLSPYSGEARVRFRFASESGADYPQYNPGNLARYYEGWYVDDVSIQARTATGPKPRVLSLRGGPNPYWAASASAGLLTFRFSAPDGLPHQGTYPMLRIFDVHGRLIRTLTASTNPLVPSQFTATWNAQDGGGRDCAAGVYIAKVDMQGRSETFRVVVVR
jgi:M6 family metalloprotease-like protein